MLIWRWQDVVHLFIYWPKAYPDRRCQEYSLCLRFSKRKRQRHFKLSAYYPREDLRVGPRFGMLSLEAKTWLTNEHGQNIGYLKSFLRFKAGLGGKRKDLTH